MSGYNSHKSVSSMSMDVLWLRPNKPENISVGRSRIAEKLEQRGHSIDVRGTEFGSLSEVLNENPDIVVGTTRLGAFVGAWVKFVKRVPLVIDHIDPIEQLKRDKGRLLTWTVSQTEKVSFRYADHVMVVYEEEIPRVKRYATSMTKTRLGVDYERFAEPNEEALDEVLNLLSGQFETDESILIYIGGLEPPYHIPAILEGMEHLQGWHFVVLGDGSQRSLVEEASEEMENVHYFGTVPHEIIPGFLHASDVGISLVNDRNSLKILEYGAAGLPTVSAKGDPEELFEGMIEFCEPEPEDVARAVSKAYDNGPSDELRKLTKRHSWSKIASEYERVFENLQKT